MPRAIKKKSRKKNVGVGAENEVVDRLSDIRDQLREKQKTVVIYGVTALTVIVAVAAIFLYRYNTADLNTRGTKPITANTRNSPRQGLSISRRPSTFSSRHTRRKNPRSSSFMSRVPIRSSANTTRQ
jgi:hypothetical protein